MKQLMDKEIQLYFDQDGLYEYEIHNANTLEVKVEKQAHVEVVITYTADFDLQEKIYIEKDCDAHILFINKSEKSKVDAQYYINGGHLKVGYHELDNKESERIVKAHLQEPDSDVTLVNTSIADAYKHYDIECIHHAHHTNSDMQNYEISKEHANYKVRASGSIKKGAYQSKSHQISRILTEGENQRSEAIPLLLIDENDVEASHANSMGKMDEEYLYYLTSRGIDEEQAKGLLTLSYVLPITEVLRDEKMNEELLIAVRNRVGL